MASWVAALRIARRDVVRHRLRTVLVVALIGLPVLVLAMTDIVYRSWQLSPTDRLTRELGRSTAELQWVGHRDLVQGADPGASGWGWSGSGERQEPAPSDRTTAAAVDGARVLPYLQPSTPVAVRTGAGVVTTPVVGLDYGDPAAQGIVEQRSGRAPRAGDEVALTSAFASASGFGVGDRIRVQGQANLTLRVVGVVRVPDDYSRQALYLWPGTATRLLPSAAHEDPHWLVDAGQSVSWRQVRRLNALGYVVTSRSVVLHPPPLSQVPMGLDSSIASGVGLEAGALVAGLVLLEVVLLAGPAFAVGARRRRHQLGLVACVGGSRAQLRRIVLADALVLGVAAGVVGVVAGMATAALIRPLLADLVGATPGSFDVSYLHLLVLVAVAVGSALLAALVPAVHAGRVDPVAALAGRRGIARSRPVLLVAGLVVIAVGAVMTQVATQSLGVVAGVALVEIGIVMSVPALIGAIARLAPILPTSGRIALRDAGRNRAAAAPAVAAVVASVIGASAAAIVFASNEATNHRLYQPSLPQRDAYVSLADTHVDAGSVVASLRRALPGLQVIGLRGSYRTCLGRGCAPDQFGGSTFGEWFPSELPPVLVDDGGTVAAIAGGAAPRVTAALRAGTTVTRSYGVVRRGRATLRTARRSVTVPTQRIGQGFDGYGAIVPPSVAARLGIATAPIGVLVVSTHPLTGEQRQAATAALLQVDDGLALDVEDGDPNGTPWVPFALVGAATVIAVIAALVATALANVDSLDDLAVLGAVGAAPRTRRTLSMSRALVISITGSVIGILAGVLPARAWVQSISQSVTIPWAALLTAAVAIPAISGGVAWLATRARLPLHRPG